MARTHSGVGELVRTFSGVVGLVRFLLDISRLVRTPLGVEFNNSPRHTSTPKWLTLKNH